MSNEQLALLLDPERKRRGWWERLFYPKGAIEKCHGKWVGFTIRQGHRHFEALSAFGDTRKYEATNEWRYTGPDYHSSDDACFRDWRPVLLAAGCIIEEGEEYNAIFIRSRNGGNEESVWQQTYRAATLAAIEELHTTKPELLREAIARVEGAANA